jgi:hypothetical protein
MWATGAFAAARCHLEKTLAQSESLDGGSSVQLSSHNGEVTSLSFLAWCLGPLGYPEQANDAALGAIARMTGIDHVPLKAFTLFFRAFFNLDFAPRLGTMISIAEEAIAFCREHGVVVYELWARICYGVALTRCGESQRGIDIMRCAMDAAARIEAKLFRPLHLGQLGVAYGLLGQPLVGVGLLKEAIRTAEVTEERLFAAELHRHHGELLSSMGDLAAAELALQQSLSVARSQGARLWELRAASSLARLWRDQGRRWQARSQP